MFDINIAIVVLILVIIFLAALLVWERIRYERRERDFLNRFMARDFLEYTRGTSQLQAKPRPVEEAIETVLGELGEDQAAVRVG